MANDQEVVWTWSFMDPVNVLFLYRFGGREIRIDLRNYTSRSNRYSVIRLSEKEVEVLTKLKEQHV
jgi:hypothetical protein